eukprot:1322143-Prymnesium_polylepis.1
MAEGGVLTASANTTTTAAAATNEAGETGEAAAPAPAAPHTLFWDDRRVRCVGRRPCAARATQPTGTPRAR